MGKYFKILLLAVVYMSGYIVDIPAKELNDYAAIKPPEMVSIKKTFKISKYEITLKQYKQFCDQTGRAYPKSPGNWMKDNMPVVNVSWHDAVAYTKWLSKVTNKTYRLPDASKWELAARANTPLSNDYFWKTKKCGYVDYANIDILKFSSNCKSKDDLYLAPVDSNNYKPNGFGLYHILGNAAEWTSECRRSRCKVQGGSWMSGPKGIRILAKSYKRQKNKRPTIGFRILLEF